MMDIDNFKQLNDTYGHPFGDEVLIQVAKTIQNQVPPGDRAVPCRYGGEEIGIILLMLPDKTARQMAENIRQRISQLRFPRQPDVTVTVSIGLLCGTFKRPLKDYQLDATRLIEEADKLLYQAKRNGKNQVVFDTFNTH